MIDEMHNDKQTNRHFKVFVTNLRFCKIGHQRFDVHLCSADIHSTKKKIIIKRKRKEKKRKEGRKEERKEEGGKKEGRTEGKKPSRGKGETQNMH